MKLKRYEQFIKESLETSSIWEIDENKIREFLIELEDAHYSIIVTFGFVNIMKKYFYNRPTVESEVFDEKILSNQPTRPAISIIIQSTAETPNSDVTDDLLTVLDVIEFETDSQIELFDNCGKIDRDDLEAQGGFFIKSSDLEIEGPLFIFVKLNAEIKFTQKQMADFYGWECDEEERDNIYVHVSLEDMADYILSSKSEWEKTLVQGEESLWDHYDISDYYLDINSLFQYTLDKENANLLIKSMIKEAGGLDDIKRHIADECDNSVWNKVKEMSELELIDYLLKERFNNTIKQLVKKSEIFSEINQTVADWELGAHVHDNYRELLSEFDSCVSDEFNFTKIKKEVEKSWKSKDREGTEVVKKYLEEETFYRIQFDNKWVEEWDSEDLFRHNLDGIFREYCGNIERYELNPRFSHYGHVDIKALNSDIKSILTRYLSK